MNSCSLGGGIVKNTHRPRGHEEEKQLFLVLVGLLIITFALSATMLIIKFFQRSLIEKKEKKRQRVEKTQIYKPCNCSKGHKMNFTDQGCPNFLQSGPDLVK